MDGSNCCVWCVWGKAEAERRVRGVGLGPGGKRRRCVASVGAVIHVRAPRALGEKLVTMGIPILDVHRDPEVSSGK
jgi:hypothetical protein